MPTHLGRLRRIERIGAGGFATVWRYYDDELASDVAVKALADNWSTQLDVRDRFLEEARILRRADSDHVVRVYDIGETQTGTPYFVMTYADRGTVAQRLSSEPAQPGVESDSLTSSAEALTATPRIPIPLMVDWIDQAAAGLTVLHDNGVIHRDIKPQNLLLRSRGDSERLLVADLGMAKAMLNASGLTQTAGTPQYMAPEQATGMGLSSRTDTYGLAAVAYRIITGTAIRDSPIDLYDADCAPPPPSRWVTVPPGVDEVLMRSLATDPADRWPDALSFASALRAAFETEQGPPSDSARPVSTRLDSDTDNTYSDSPGRSVGGNVDQSPTRHKEAEQQRKPAALLLGLWVLLVLGVSFAAGYLLTVALN